MYTFENIENSKKKGQQMEKGRTTMEKGKTTRKVTYRNRFSLRSRSKNP